MRMTTVLGLAGLVITALGLQMMISGFSGWLVGPTVSYGPYNASSYEFEWQIPPSSIKEVGGKESELQTRIG